MQYSGRMAAQKDNDFLPEREACCLGCCFKTRLSSGSEGFRRKSARHFRPKQLFLKTDSHNWFPDVAADGQDQTALP